SCFENHYLVPCSAAECGDAAVSDGAADLMPTTCHDSSSCPASAPVCMGGHCTGCAFVDGGASSDCATYHASTPYCGPSGACVECMSKVDCASVNKACTSSFVCGDCVHHADCPSGACGADHHCVDPANIAYVDKDLNAAAPDGSKSHPFHQL